MKPEIKNYINTVLSKIAILDEPNVAFEQVEILEYRTHFENGSVFQHQNGDNYGLAILNAITEDSSFKISKFLKKETNLSIKNIQDELEKHYLRCYIPGSSKEYDTWKTGDLGVAYLEINDAEKTISVRYTNETNT
ncbi:hypothetical protein FHR24_001364 [Wenyingzhuangia heitensis]|uniref:Uncharacterized protein n=1 Tax=Wenyingzhuangia heitensis TaxID=1487859 RepID=A0ABX0U7V7_9FLAO|nr:hypothetical protein [Wenyingzhuangia heitensis]NIJ44925.1 hypothetical protein [Wenyingzhuangia heitensis]